LSETSRYLIAISTGVPVFVIMAAVVAGQDPLLVNLHHVFADISRDHWLGADGLGRDVLARLAAGLQLSLMVGVVVVVGSGLIGIMVGLFSAWLGGWWDDVLMRIADIVLAFPGILLAIALAAMLGPGVENLVLALTAVGWVGFARLTRGQVMALKQVPFVQAAVSNGVAAPVVAYRHLLPNIAAPLLVEASFGLAAVIIGEAGLSFLGVGVQPPQASLGTMIREGTRVMLVQPLLVVWPGLVLLSMVMAVNLLGDALRDRLDVRMTRD